MFKNLLLTFFLFFSSFATIYPSKKENTSLFDYCFSLEKIIIRNSLEKTNNLSDKFQTFAKKITLFGINKTKGALVNNIIDQYKTSSKLFVVTIVPNQFYCFGGYWIEELNPGTFQSIFFEKSKEKINQIKDIKKEANEFIKDINSEYKTIEKEADKFIKDINSEYKSIEKEAEKFIKDINSEYKSIKNQFNNLF